MAWHALAVLSANRYVHRHGSFASYQVTCGRRPAPGRSPMPKPNDRPVTIIAGVNVLEDAETALRVGEVFRKTCDSLKMPYTSRPLTIRQTDCLLIVFADPE